MVPASCFPDETCSENDGAGWSARTTAPKDGTVLVTFTAARDDRGRRFGGVRMLASALVPLEHVPGSAHPKGAVRAAPRRKAA